MAKTRGANWNGALSEMVAFLTSVLVGEGGAPKPLAYSPSFEDPVDIDELSKLVPVLKAARELQDDLLIRTDRRMSRRSRRSRRRETGRRRRRRRRRQDEGREEEKDQEKEKEEEEGGRGGGGGGGGGDRPTQVQRHQGGDHEPHIRQEAGARRER
eukprot:9184698-Pyramimonas_sp.AAC.1